jgi:integrase
MSIDLRAAAAEYLAQRRALGYQLIDHDWLLARFLDQLDDCGTSTIRVADAVAFAQARPGTGRRWQAARLHAVRGFAAHVHALDPASAEVIPARLVPARVTRRIPYLYSAEQITGLMSATASMFAPMLAASMHTLIGLLAVTGLRSGEAIALDVEHIDEDRRLLTVTGKYGRRRLIPMHASTLHALRDYQQVRAAQAAPCGPLLVGVRGRRLNQAIAQAAFQAVVRSCELPARPGCGAPRLHDLRHSFAVNSLIDAVREGDDVDARIAALATFLGHVDPINTYWYMTASPQLMSVVSQRVNLDRERRRS